MNHDAEFFESRAAGEDVELARVDALLARSARAMPIPEGLAERIFAATVGLLLPQGGSYRFEPVLARSAAREPLFSRLALAASVALVALVGWSTFHIAAQQPLQLSSNAFSVVASFGQDGPDRFLGMYEDDADNSESQPDMVDTFGIMGTELDDLLGEFAQIDDVLGS